MPKWLPAITLDLPTVLPPNTGKRTGTLVVHDEVCCVMLMNIDPELQWQTVLLLQMLLLNWGMGRVSLRRCSEMLEEEDCKIVCMRTLVWTMHTRCRFICLIFSAFNSIWPLGHNVQTLDNSSQCFWNKANQFLKNIKQSNQSQKVIGNGKTEERGKSEF